MQRPKLEVASWIAGIVGVLVTVYLGFFNSSTDTSTSAVAASAPITARVVQPATPAAPASAAVATTSSITEATAVAKQIPSMPLRDAELHRRAMLGVQRQEFPAAGDAAAAVKLYVTRDALLDVVSCYAAHHGDTLSARKAAEQIQTYLVKERALARLSLLLSTKSGEGSNEPICKAL